MQDFRNLKVWEKAHRLTLAVYKATVNFPKEELYALTGQIRRSSASIPSNIAEGCGRRGGADLAHSLQIAMGSASELEYQLFLSCELGFLGAQDHKRLAAHVGEVKMMLASLIRKLRTDN